MQTNVIAKLRISQCKSFRQNISRRLNWKLCTNNWCFILARNFECIVCNRF